MEGESRYQHALPLRYCFCITMYRSQFSGAALSNRKYRLDIHNVHHVDSGKTTPVLQYSEIDENLCFSLILADGSSVDFEASSR
jgi:hypothetical protein